VTLHLREYETRHRVPLNPVQIAALQAARVAVTPSDVAGRFDLRPGPVVGVLKVGGQQFAIAPKVGISRLLFLVSYALQRSWTGDDLADLDDADTLVDAMAVLYASAVDRALRQGVRRGYVRRHESGTKVRGRLDVATQLRRHQGRMLPVEIQHDEHTLDTLQNQILLTATLLLRGLTIRSRTARQQLARTLGRLEGVTPLDPRRVPLDVVALDRLNAHYAPALSMATMIIRGRSLEAAAGETESTSLLFNMNTVFEDFVVETLREHLGLSAGAFPQNAVGKGLRLDEAGLIKLKPDLSWWESGRCVFVGDAKYKRLTGEGLKHADLYQLLTYTISTGLPSGLLVYAAGEAEPATHVVNNAGKRLVVTSMDLSGDLRSLRHETERIAALVQSVRLAGIGQGHA
jgi:5-methylcytosine-specific restriction enzyme subunit McrC